MDVPLFLCVIYDVDGTRLCTGEGDNDTNAYLDAMRLVRRYFPNKEVLRRHDYVRMATP